MGSAVHIYCHRRPSDWTDSQIRRTEGPYRCACTRMVYQVGAHVLDAPLQLPPHALPLSLPEQSPELLCFLCGQEMNQLRRWASDQYGFRHDACTGMRLRKRSRRHRLDPQRKASPSDPKRLCLLCAGGGGPHHAMPLHRYHYLDSPFLTTSQHMYDNPSLREVSQDPLHTHARPQSLLASLQSVHAWIACSPLVGCAHACMHACARAPFSSRP